MFLIIVFERKVHDMGIPGENFCSNGSAYQNAENIGDEIVLIHPAARHKELMDLVGRGKGYGEKTGNQVRMFVHDGPKKGTAGQYRQNAERRKMKHLVKGEHRVIGKTVPGNR